MIPLWLKIAVTVFVVVLVMVYARRWGWANFLWFSDLALIAMVPALWCQNALLASVIALVIVLPDGLWIVGFVAQLVTGRRVFGLSDYMFDRAKPRWLRALSLFHLWMPPLALWLVARLGYAPDALPVAVVFVWIVMAICYACTEPDENINWVFGFAGTRQARRSPLRQLALTMTLFPLVVVLPTHLVLKSAFR